MSTIIVTFTATLKNAENQSYLPIGNLARTEVITIPAKASGSSQGTLVVEDGEQCIAVYASAACYVLTGTNPHITSTEGDFGHYVPASTQLYFQAAVGEKVAVVGVV